VCRQCHFLIWFPITHLSKKKFATCRHDYGQKQYVDAALKLVDMQQRGKVRHIGVTNFDVPRVQQLVDAGVPIVSNQVGGRLLPARRRLPCTALC